MKRPGNRPTNFMERVTCTCKPSELLACAYCRTEYYRTLRLAMKSGDESIRLSLTYFGERRPYRTRFMQYGQIVKKLEAA